VILARAAHLAALLSLVGTLLHGVTVAGRGRHRLEWGSLLVALAAGAAWLLLEAGSMADETQFPAMLAAVPAVLFETLFGRVLLIRCGLLLLAGALLAARRPGLALLPAAAALAAQSWIGHPFASGDASLLAASVLHVLAAGAWLGGLLPLWLLIGALPGPQAARAADRFFRVGLLSVLVLAATAFWQGSRLIGSAAGLLGTGYGHLALVKLVLFAALLLPAARNRLVLTPALADAGGAGAKRRLRRSIVAATAIGLGVVLTAGALATRPPAFELPD
jgi:putative copper resistance protein D